MPLYLFKCPDSHTFETFASMKDAPRTATCECGQPAMRDYLAEHPTSVVGMIDGEQLMYGPPALGPYANPGKSLLRVLKNNNAWHEMVKRSEGKIGDIS